MSGPFLSRVSLRRDASTGVVAELIYKSLNNERELVAHSLLWTLFGDDPERKRDFLWLETEPGHYLILSEREAVDRHNLFNIETKLFQPSVKKGDYLNFSLRANATIARKLPEQKRGVRHDIVMNALYKIPKEERSLKRDILTQKVGCEWLAHQGELSGFELSEDFFVTSTSVLSLARKYKKPAIFGVMEMRGTLKVTDPEKLLNKVRSGFGRARAFGCGLMLIKPA
ncbi:type I-E CRISPR-associated protein Cas6/Cse3/CasE [Aristophania vespae]|uniref:type I-E CRISPR-associated protein Cas6/Cse3/CasE n=1 Tax=Aristophania vespae TaxID=2697033 RepID=UPI0023519C3A|nr:type I-E CRISPR-associated protein Cas6/Cse3/CasE [Aristophania vespae]UMM64421.1 hypothetical protein DM15PD_14350 [Aristophania vespae]